MTAYARRENILWECYGEDTWHEFQDLDPRETVERVFVTQQANLVDLLPRWQREMAGAKTEDDVRAAGGRLGMNRWDPPESLSWVRWAAWFETRLIEAVEHPETLIPPDELPSPFRWRHRTAPTLPPRLARQLAVEAVDHHADRVDAWLTSDVSTGCRLYLLADLGRHLGHVHDLADPRPEERDPDDRVDDDATPDTVITARRPTTRIGVRLARTYLDEQSLLDIQGVHLAEPVDARGHELVRDRWPALTALLGGWFSDRERWSPYMAQFQMLRTEHYTFFRAAVIEGRELLTLDDADLRHAVRALGCYVEPPHLRWWLTWMFWRIEEFWIPEYG